MVVSVVAMTVCLASCGSSSSVGSGPARHHGSSAVDIVVTRAGCATSPSTAPPGVVNFTVTSKNSSSVQEVELRQSDGHRLAEQPNLAPGLLGGITADLGDGTYQIYCPGATETTSTFTVSSTAPAQTWRNNARLEVATFRYRSWVRHQLTQLTRDTATFASAVEAGDLTRAEALYAPAREDFESIDPVSEAFDTLDLDIDGEIENFGSRAQFQGFHEIEESLWVDHSLAGQSKYATELVAAVRRLQAAASGTTYQPAQIGDYVISQLEEAGNFVATGSEERYSHLDLIDLKGALEGASEAVSVVTPVLTATSPALLAQLTSALASARAALAALAQNPGSSGSGYVSLTSVTEAQRQHLADVVLAVAAPLAQATRLVV